MASTQWLSTTKIPLKDGSGNIVGLVGISRDISERIQYEIFLKENEEKYSSLFQSSNDPILLYDRNGDDIIDANQKALHVFEWNPEQLLSKNIKALHSEKSMASLKRAFRFA